MTGLPGAVLIGLGSILGTGVFVSLAIAAGPAGAALPLAILLAGLLAGANGLAAAQLAAVMPVSGGTYAYGRKLISPLVGFMAGWLFLCAKTASAAAAALSLVAYLQPLLDLNPPVLRVGAVLVVGLVTAAALLGLRRSQWLNAVLVSGALLSLGIFVVGAAGLKPLPQPVVPAASSGSGIAEATALLFVAFTGYGRIATMGEDVSRPERTIPRAVLLTLALVLAVYLAVAVAALRLAGAEGLADSLRSVVGVAAAAPPLASLLQRAGWSWGGSAVALGAVFALLGVLLNLVLGLSRVWLAMGRSGDMPPGLARLNTAGSCPVPAVILSGLLIAALSQVGGLAFSWGFSAFTVLGYYAITNLCVLRLPAEQRRWPGALAWLGLLSCLGLAFMVPVVAWASGLAVLAVGVLWRSAFRAASFR